MRVRGPFFFARRGAGASPCSASSCRASPCYVHLLSLVFCKCVRRY
jgi:hypothetical protein